MERRSYLTERLWPMPKHRTIGSFSDLTLYVDTLACARDSQGITAALLQSALAPRLRASRLVHRQALSTIRSVLEELVGFGWLRRDDALPAARFALTVEGVTALQTACCAERSFLRQLANQMHAVYTIPGWFVARLWTINPQSGEVILPVPVQGWSASLSSRAYGKWGPELEQETTAALRRAQQANPAAFPVSADDWIAAVSQAWLHVLTRKRRKPTPVGDALPWTRSGLALAMRMAALRLFFGAIPYGAAAADVSIEEPLSVKTFNSWCPRLQSLELVAYTDWHPSVVGRLLFPTAVFRSGGGAAFEELPQVRHPDGRRLFLHQPSWTVLRERFWANLAEVYQRNAQVMGVRYVSLFEVRDEVCRRLRISPSHFDLCLGFALEEPYPVEGWQLSLETDVREDMRSGGQLERCPVSVGGVRYTIIAMAQCPSGLERTI
jgi:hypothetical protein